MDARTGAVAEEQEWGKDGAANGLAIRDGTLLGTNLASPALASPVSDGHSLTATGARGVYRNRAPLTIDGLTDDWARHRPAAWDAPGKEAGKLLISADDEYLYLGVSAAGDGLDEKNTRLDLSTTIGGKPARWSLRPGADGKVVWDGPRGTPDGAKAAVRQPLGNGVLAYELAIPRAWLVPSKDARLPGPGRVGLELALSHDDPTGKASAPLVRINDMLCLRWLTKEQEDAALSAARLLPDLDASWLFMEQVWRTRTPGDDQRHRVLPRLHQTEPEGARRRRGDAPARPVAPQVARLRSRGRDSPARRTRRRPRVGARVVSAGRDNVPRAVGVRRPTIPAAETHARTVRRRELGPPRHRRGAAR